MIKKWSCPQGAATFNVEGKREKGQSTSPYIVTFSLLRSARPSRFRLWLGQYDMNMPGRFITRCAVATTGRTFSLRRMGGAYSFRLWRRFAFKPVGEKVGRPPTSLFLNRVPNRAFDFTSIRNNPRPGNVSGPCSKLCYMTECGVHGLMSLYLVKKGVVQWRVYRNV